MKKTKKFYSFFIAVTVGLCSAASVSANDGVELCYEFNTTEDSVLFVEWNDTFESVEEMIEKSDINIIGTVISQEVEQRNDLYFTHSYIEDECGEIYDVLQTGAIIENKEINIPYGSTILECNEEYFLCLNQTEYDDIYGQYYLIAGGNQGCGLYDSSINTAFSLSMDTRSVFSAIEFNSLGDIEMISEFPIEPNSNSGLELSAYKWYKQRISFYVSESISSTYGATINSYIKQGATSWNPYTSLNLYATNTANSTTADILLFMNNYGNTNWAGATYLREKDDSTAAIERVQIQLNSYAGYLDDPLYWRAISCHEFGHSVGLGHCSSGSQQNVMREDLSSAFPSNRNLYCPQTDDILAIQSKYE